MRAAIILAAGRSSRFAGGNKLLARCGGKPLLLGALAAARRAPVARVMVVFGRDPRIARLVRGRGVSTVRVRDRGEGVAASLRAGLQALRPRERELFVFLADMPLTPAALPFRLARRLRPGVTAVRPMASGLPGHPVLLRRPAPAEVAELSGDRGLAPLLARREVRAVPVPRQAVADVDARGDLARLRLGRKRLDGARS